MGLTLVVEALFTAVFLRVLIGYLRKPTPLQRDVMVMFAALAVPFVLAVLRQTVGEPPRVVTVGGSVLLLGHPFVTLRLVRRLAAVPSRVYRATLFGWLLSGALLVGAGEVLGGWTVLAVVGFFVVAEVLAATYLARLARARTGAPRARLWLAAAATALFATAILVAGVGAADPEDAEPARQAARLIALLSAAAYLLAFAPPAWVRSWWSTRAAYRVIRQLVQTPPDASAAVIWHCYAASVHQATSATGVVVLAGDLDGTTREIASVGVPRPVADRPYPSVSTRWSSSAGGTTATIDIQAPQTPPVALAYVRAAGAAFVTIAPLRLRTGDGVLLLLNRYQSLFTEDDVQLLGELGAQVSALADRADLFTERDQLTAQLSESVDALSAASKAKSDFMANMSHELRTPLNAIIGFSDLMRTEPASQGLTAVPTEWVQHIHSSGQHLLGLINEVLDLAKIESGKVELHCEPLDLFEAIDEVVVSLTALARRKQLDVMVAVPPLRVRADRTRLRQIVTNLLANAVKFTPEQGQIFVSARRVGTDIAFTVADTGPGIAAADQQRIFEEFQQAGDQRARAAGTGLGLTLTQRLVQAHGGRIELHSELGQGTRFTVYLPAADVPAADLPGAAPDHQPGPNILIIEDDPAAARLLTTHLSRAGHTVTVAASGEQGLDLARSCNPEAIVLDVQLPGIDGWQVLAALKADVRLRHVPVVIVSVVDDVEAGLAFGAVDYFVKPVDRPTLLAWFARHGLIPLTNGSQPKVLAIDDDPHSRRIIDSALTADGIQVTTAAGGVDGLAAARAGRFDLVICDLLMPDLDGFDVIAALHDDPATRNTPVVVLTAHTLTDAEKHRLSGKVVAITNKAGGADGLPELVHMIGELTGLTATADAVQT